MAQKTAVEWLEIRFYFTKGQLIDIDFQQALEMEKEQRIQDYSVGYSNGQVDSNRTAEQYYNKTFKSE